MPLKAAKLLRCLAPWLGVLIVGTALWQQQCCDRGFHIGGGNAWGMSWPSYFGWPFIAVHGMTVERFDISHGRPSPYYEITTTYEFLPWWVAADSVVNGLMLPSVWWTLFHFVRRERWIQFSLRTLFTFVLVAAALASLTRTEEWLNVQYENWTGEPGSHFALVPWYLEVPRYFGVGCMVYAGVSLVSRLAGRTLPKRPKA